MCRSSVHTTEMRYTSTYHNNKNVIILFTGIYRLLFVHTMTLNNQPWNCRAWHWFETQLSEKASLYHLQQNSTKLGKSKTPVMFTTWNVFFFKFFWLSLCFKKTTIYLLKIKNSPSNCIYWKYLFGLSLFIYFLNLTGHFSSTEQFEFPTPSSYLKFMSSGE